MSEILHQGDACISKSAFSDVISLIKSLYIMTNHQRSVRYKSLLDFLSTSSWIFGINVSIGSLRVCMFLCQKLLYLNEYQFMRCQPTITVMVLHVFYIHSDRGYHFPVPWLGFLILIIAMVSTAYFLIVYSYVYTCTCIKII